MFRDKEGTLNPPLAEKSEKGFLPSNRRALLPPLVALLAIVALFVLPQVAPSYVVYVVSLAMVNIIAVTGLNIVMGYAGLVSLGHAGFVAVGAYGTALLMAHLGLPFGASAIVASLAAMLVGFLVGLPALRVGAVYLAMTTFGFGEAVHVILLNWLDLTRGANGLRVPAPAILGYEFNSTTFYYVIAVAFLLLTFLARRIILSPMGRAFVALRDSELAAQAVGIQPSIFKTLAFAVSAFYGGLSGALFAGLARFINPDSFTFGDSLFYLNMNVVGGMGTFLGPIVGGATMTVLPEFVRSLGQYRGVFSGFILLFFLVFMPNGIVGVLKNRFKR